MFRSWNGSVDIPEHEFSLTFNLINVYANANADANANHITINVD